MSQINNLKRSFLACEGVASSSTDCNSTPHKRRRQTIQALEALGALIKSPSIDDGDNKLNKNDILSLTLARLLRQKYWPSNAYYKDVELAANVRNLSTVENLNGFIVVCNTSGRIIFFSDNVEFYLRKNVRSLYPQLTNIYNCVNEEDHPSIRHVLSRPSNIEQRIICKWNLPRGKRPSRTHTETKTMLMTGHFFTIDDEQNNEHEPLFIARCEQILSSTPNIPANNAGTINTTTIRLVLNDQLHISEISPNTEALLGYKAEELIDQSLRRIMVAEYVDILEQARQQCAVTQHYTTMNVMDLYTNTGDRLTFLCNIHTLVEGRRKAMKVGFLAQLIDPRATNEFMTYAHLQNKERLKATTTRQDSSPSSNIGTVASTIKNILYAYDEQSLTSNNISLVCPTAVLPQRRKRRRVTYKKVKIEPLELPNNHYQCPEFTNDSNEAHTVSSESRSSSVSPIQEVGLTEELLSFTDEPIEYENIKLIQEFPSIEDINDIFGINNDDQQYFLFTPTVSTLNFFA